MKLISWNVNGLRAIMGKNFMEFFEAADADIFCLQETKLQAGADRDGSAGLSSVLELRREKRLFRNCNLYKAGAD